MDFARISASIALAMFACSWPLQASAAAGSTSEYVRLVDPDWIPPVVASVKQGVFVRGLFGKTFRIGKELHDIAGEKAIVSRVEDELRKGLDQANRFGQKGALIKLRVVAARVEKTDHLNLLDLVVVGVGPDPDSVCFAAQCFNSLETPNPDPKMFSYTSSTGYYWITAAKNGKDMNYHRFEIAPIEQRARTVVLHEAARSAYSRAVSASAIAGYAERLAADQKKADQQAVIKALISSRDSAIGRMEQIDRELWERMERARRADRLGATLKMVSGALSLASQIYLAKAALPADTKIPPDVTSEQLSATAKSVYEESHRTIIQMQNSREEQQTIIIQSDTKILDFGAQNGMQVQPGTVFKPLLN
jgi:hypothetical protein